MACNLTEITMEDVEIVLVWPNIPFYVVCHMVEAATMAVADDDGVATAGVEAGGGNGSATADGRAVAARGGGQCD